jgi:hypothetical protein
VPVEAHEVADEGREARAREEPALATSTPQYWYSVKWTLRLTLPAVPTGVAFSDPHCSTTRI